MKTRKRTKERKSLNRLIKDADRLFQLKYIAKHPFSIISGEPTGVMHHFIQKKQSNALRYDEDNGIPLTCAEHTRHHACGDPTILKRILEAKGEDWFNLIQEKRKQKVKFTEEYLKEIIRKLNEENN
jgi:hypothetical protein